MSAPRSQPVAAGTSALEEALRESEENFRRAFDFAPTGMAILGPDGRWIRVNKALSEMLGYSPEEFQGTTFQQLTHPDDISLSASASKNVLGGHVPIVQIEKRYRHKNGSYLWTRLTTSVVHDPDGAPLHYLSQIEDISERRRLEAHLRQMQKIESVGLLAGGIAHDFNNILGAMTLQLGLLLGTPTLDPATKQAISELDDQARRAGALVRQLLLFSRRSVVDVQSLDVNHLVEHVLTMLRRLLDQTIQLSFEPSAAIGSIEADAGMIEQVVMNLIVNARDAMPGGGRLTVSSRVVDLDASAALADPKRRVGRFVVLAVADTGSGMDGATLARIFEPFFTTKESGKGTGLGLPTVQGIVDQHRGWVEVTSEVGKGTLVEAFFPELPRESLVPKAKPPSVPPAPSGEGQLILLVEDDASVRRVASRCLRAAGYTVIEAGNADDALILWETRRDEICLLFTDMMMPGTMNGLELATRLLAEKPALQVLLSSGYSLEMQEQGKPADPRIVYLPKPFDVNGLLRVLKRQLEG